jgi:hypothetical protein
MRFVALYTGRKLSEAKLVALTGDSDAISAVAQAVLSESKSLSTDDPALRQLERGRIKALEQIVGDQIRGGKQ